MGVSALRRVQIGKETTKFTAVPAAYRLVGVTPELKLKTAFEAISGWTGGFVRASGEYMTERSGTGSLKGPLLLDVEGLAPFIFGMHSYVRSGAGPYLYVFRQGINAAPNPPTATWEFGDGTEIFQANGGLVTDWTLNGRIGKSVELDSTWEFGDVSLTALNNFTSIAVPSGTNEVQTITITGTPTGGTFTLTFNGWTTGPIAYNATAAVVQAALDALPSIGPGNSVAAGGPLPGTGITVTFTGALAATDVPAMVGTSSLTGGTTPTVNVASTTAGVPAVAANYATPDRKPPVVLTNGMQFFIDGTSIGVNLMSFSLKYTTGLNVTGKIDGTIAQNDVSYKVPTSSATIVVETSTNQANMVADLEAETRRAFRLANAATNPSFAVDWVGQVVDVATIGDSDGISTVQFTIRDAWQQSKLPDPIRVSLQTAAQSF